jgi:hypothetical protein
MINGEHDRWIVVELNTAALYTTQAIIWAFGRKPTPLHGFNKSDSTAIISSAQRDPGLCEFEPMCVTKIVLGVADPGQDGARWSPTSRWS